MAIKGAILGDILGSQYEFNRPKDLDWRNVSLIRKMASYTDDTVMTLAVKKAILEGRDFAEVMVEFGRRYPNAGYGGRFRNWIFSDDHRPYNSWGNGSAMRVSFVGEYFEDFEEMQRAAEAAAAVTHDHPEGIKGAVVTATCVWMAKHGKSRQEILEYVLEQYPKSQYLYGADIDMETLRKSYRWSVKCCDTVPAAMRCFFESTDYESFMRNIYSLNCDSDTFGAVAGGVAEEFFGGFGGIDAEEILKFYLPAELYELMLKNPQRQRG